MSTLHRIRVRAALALVGLIAGLLLAELGLRVVSPIRGDDLLPLSYNREAIRRIAVGDAYLRFDATLGWVPASSIEQRDGSATYRTNSAGIRADREYAPEPPPSTRRLATFGDSFTHCDEVSNPQCWSSQLERAWPGTEVLNFGVPGYAPDQGMLRYERDGRPFRPCAVVVGYMTENINRLVNRFRPFYAPETGIALSKPRFLLDGDGLVPLPNPTTTPEQLDDPRWVEAELGPHDRWYFPGMFVPHPMDAFQLVRVARSAAYRRARLAQQGGGTEDKSLAHAYREDQEAYRVTGRVLIEFARQVRQDGATPIVLVFTGKSDVVAVRRREEKVYQPLLHWLEREGIPTIDTTDGLAREANRTGVDPLVAKGGHYSGRGNQVIADTLARQLPGLTDATCGGAGV